MEYIPTKMDKLKLYKQLEHAQQQKVQIPAKEIPVKQVKPLNKKQLSDLLSRLTKITKKQYQIERQTSEVLQTNLKIRNKRRQSQKVEQRLIQYGKKIQQKKLHLGKQLHKKQQQRYHRDVPEISQKGKNVKQKTIDRRLQKILKERGQRKEQLKKYYQPSFAPTIDPYSQFITDLQNLGDLFNRMQSRQQQALKKKEALSKEIQQKIKQDYTFEPRINQNSRAIAESLPRRPLSSGESLYDKKTANQTLQESFYPFAPTINKNSSEIIRRKDKDIEQSCFSRLFNQAKQIQQRKTERIRQRISQNSYRPSINKKSLRLVNQSSRKQSQASVNTFEDCEQVRVGRSMTDRIKSNSMHIYKTDQVWQLKMKKKCYDFLHKSHMAAACLQ